MNVWLVTLGSSDVQLRDKEVWSDWYDEIKRSLYDIDRGRFEPVRLDESDDVPYRIASRVLGIVDEQVDGVRDELEYPLLFEFCGKLKEKGEAIDRIVVLMSDQSDFFDEDQRSSYRCPFWQDTCGLFEIVSDYLKLQFPNAEIEPLVLRPLDAASGLDDWDAVLKVVQGEFKGLEMKPERVFVSHQAGTPAISSAVQFASLARFGDRVQFLVSNEFDGEKTRTIESSSYLFNLKKNAALELLKNYDYAGVQKILEKHLSSEIPEQKRIQKLLDACIEWNHAEFQKFKKCLQKGNILEIKEFPWWRSGYESAYLAWVRLQQGNTVEALFHSFRGLEGTVIAWCRNEFKDHLHEHPKYGTQLKRSILDILPGYEGALSRKSQENWKDFGGIGLYGDPLYELLKQAKPQWKTHPYIKIVWESAKGKRNTVFHKIEGLTEQDVFDAWQAMDEAGWMKCMVSCLNFVSGQSFKSLEEASLMYRVHEELRGAIENYNPPG